MKSFRHSGNRSGRLLDSSLPISCGYILPFCPDTATLSARILHKEGPLVRAAKLSRASSPFHPLVLLPFPLPLPRDFPIPPPRGASEWFEIFSRRLAHSQPFSVRSREKISFVFLLVTTSRLPTFPGNSGRSAAGSTVEKRPGAFTST